MSYASLIQCSRDNELLDRLNAAIAKEAWNNATIAETALGKSVRSAGPSFTQALFVWPLCLNIEADYEYAINVGMEPVAEGDPPHPTPGSATVVPDGALLNAVQTNWPMDPAPE